MSKIRQLILKLHNFDNNKVLQAVEELKTYGWLLDGALEGIDLHFTHLQKANLSKANLQRVNLNMADLRWADLTQADLRDAHLNHANLYRADLHETNLVGASLIRANLQNVKNLQEAQLAQAYSLFGATMPDGSIYGGGFNLQGDIHQPQARRTEAIADLYEESEQRRLHKEIATGLSYLSDAHLILKLRSFDNNIVAKAVEELRIRGILTDGTLNWIELHFAHLQGLDLNLADLSMADLHSADLSYARLPRTNLHMANLCGVFLLNTDLRGAILSHTILQGVYSWTYEQFVQLDKLRNAMMPDGSRYDGRFNLTGDLNDAQIFGVDPENPGALADFFGVSFEDYLAGQSWAQTYLSSTWSYLESSSITITKNANKHRAKLSNHIFTQI